MNTTEYGRRRGDSTAGWYSDDQSYTNKLHRRAERESPDGFGASVVDLRPIQPWAPGTKQKERYWDDRATGKFTTSKQMKASGNRAGNDPFGGYETYYVGGWKLVDRWPCLQSWEAARNKGATAAELDLWRLFDPNLEQWR